MKKYLLAWSESVDRSIEGKDYAEGMVSPPDLEPVSWNGIPAYQPYLKEWKDRPEYRAILRSRKTNTVKE